MITRTFLMLPTVGRATERKLWREGVVDWDCFLSARSVSGMSAGRKGKLNAHLRTAEQFLRQGETSYFTRLLPQNEHWRFFEDVRDRIAYLDIETDGLGPSCVTTVVGIHRKSGTTTLVRGMDLNIQNLQESLRGSALIVTFNGSSFDLPILEREYPFSIPIVPHFDLRHGCARLGMHGGLKRIEREMGIARDRDLEYMTGEEAVWLWHLWEKDRNENALNTLIRYNTADIRNLEPIAESVCRQLKKRTLDLGETA
ncbi:MAG TPA: ribonuclease H-like domain-containing protein [Methanomassiliicoccales archaeon]|nr:ribonuclease H-like domain-containing protein [Methanomassiliicoccales archaeon]